MQISKKISLFFFLLSYINFIFMDVQMGGDARKFPPEPEKRVKKNLEEGRGFRLMGTLEKKWWIWRI